MTRFVVTTEPAQVAAAEIGSELRAAVADRGHAAIAFSGGTTPRLMFDELASHQLPWPNIDVFQVDERVVTPESDDRNWRFLQARLLDPSGVPRSRRHPMPVDSPDLVTAALRYADEVTTHAPDGLEIVHLGLGDDGHTASWPPGDLTVPDSHAVTVVGPYRGHLRMTLTPPAVNAARRRIWLVAGASKSNALNSLRQGGLGIPAGLARQADTDLIVCDEAAQG